MNRRKFLQMIGAVPFAGALGFKASEEPRRRFSGLVVERIRFETSDMDNEFGCGVVFDSGMRFGIEIPKWKAMTDREICAFIRNWANEDGASLSEDMLRTAVYKWRSGEIDRLTLQRRRFENGIVHEWEKPTQLHEHKGNVWLEQDGKLLKVIR